MADTESVSPLVKVRDLKMYFPIHAGLFRSHVGDIKAVDGISFDIMPGETLGLVGESGCGKSTVGRSILRLYDVTSGTVEIDGSEIAHVDRDSLRSKRPTMQMIFQDPQASLNPRMTVASIIGEPLDEHMKLSSDERLARIYELMDWVGLNRAFAKRYPHEFSGGQRQRIGIARALALNPKFIVCDEPIAALDVSIQAQVVNLLEELQDRLDLTYLFISHDLSMVRHIADRVAVMYLGRIVEVASRETLFCRTAAPLHPGAAFGGAGARSRIRAASQADRAAGRRALACQSAQGLQFFNPMPEGHGHLPADRARGPGFRRGKAGGLPPLFREHDNDRGTNRRRNNKLKKINKETAMKLRTILMGAVAAMAIAPVAHAERGSDGEVKIIYWQAPSILNPYLSGGTKDIEAASLIVEPLARFNEKGHWFPSWSTRSRLSKTAACRADLTSITWKLKEGLKWSDGTPVTSADVKFTRLLHGARRRLRAERQVRRRRKHRYPGRPDHRGQLHRSEAVPYAAFVGAQSPIIQKAQFADCLGAKAQECTSANFGPIGTGPFVVTDFKPNDVITMKANENYRDPAKPAFATLTFKGGGDAAAAGRAVMETGEFDYAWNLQLAPDVIAKMAEGGKGTPGPASARWSSASR
jgi:oligopeptide transport system ATP-binding protein